MGHCSGVTLDHHQGCYTITTTIAIQYDFMFLAFFTRWTVAQTCCFFVLV